MRDHEGKVYRGGGGLIRSSKVRTGSFQGAAGRRIWGAFEVFLSLVCGLILLSLMSEASWDHGLDRVKLVWSGASGSHWRADDRWTCVCRWDHQQQGGKCLFLMSYWCWAGLRVCITCQHCNTVWQSPVATLRHLLQDRSAFCFC